MWKIQFKMVPVVTPASGAITLKVDEWLQQIEDTSEISVQKSKDSSAKAEFMLYMFTVRRQSGDGPSTYRELCC